MYYITKYGPIIYVTGWVVVAQLPIMNVDCAHTSDHHHGLGKC
jgi:hypothetical protein